MKWITRHLFTAGLAIALVLGAATSAHAQFFTKIATFQTGGGGNVPNVVLVNGTTSGGAIFTNNFTTTTPGIGGGIISVGSNVLTTYSQSGGGAVPVTFNGMPVVAVFAIKGTSVPDPMNPAAFIGTFNQGKVGLFTIPNLASYNQYNPTSWGATNAAGTMLNTPLAVFDLAAPQDVFPGGGTGIFNLTANQVNVSAINTVVGANAQGNFLFVEAADGANPGLAFMTVTGPGLPPPPPFFVTGEGIVSRSDQAIDVAPNLTFIDGGFGDPGFVALNTIAGAFAGFSNLGGAGTAFATGFGGGSATDFNIGGAFGFLGPDVITSVGLTSAPGVFINQQQDIPEPASFLM